MNRLAFYLGCIFILIIFIGYHTMTGGSLILYLPQYKTREILNNSQKLLHKNITILWYARQGYFYGNSNLTECEYTNCVLTDNKSLLNSSTAVLFSYRDMRNNIPFKKANQIWVVVNIESPAHDGDWNPVWNNKFDWSMTYRKDSEVYLNYVLFNRTNPVNKNYHQIFNNKTKSVSWVVSNCYGKSKRNEYVNELKKYIDVDIYGRCTGKKCPGKGSELCHDALSQNYKFYLGFENSLCKDYATEKIYHTYRENSNAIYVARGAPNIKSFLPPKTYIDTRDFDSPKALAEYLIKLGNNESDYVSILKEIDKYSMDERNYIRSLCDLCKLLNTYKSRDLAWTGRKFKKWYTN